MEVKLVVKSRMEVLLVVRSLLQPSQSYQASQQRSCLGTPVESLLVDGVALCHLHLCRPQDPTETDHSSAATPSIRTSTVCVGALI